jgi:hypothetical protein
MFLSMLRNRQPGIVVCRGDADGGCSARAWAWAKSFGRLPLLLAALAFRLDRSKTCMFDFWRMLCGETTQDSTT